MKRNYKMKSSNYFREDLKFIRDKKFVDPSDWGLFEKELQVEFEKLDEDWKEHSKEITFGPLSPYGYRKRYMHSIPLPHKQKRKWPDLRSDFRIVFNVNEEKKEIFYFAIGKRIKKVDPRDPDDIWTLLKQRTPPEEE
ncbi:hypothetical protein P6709_19485 [Jeotgalibacillus sp. ET6]|uniref:hypothetical protein n=1 Tax=Jeotgalibacillus sp. ET6 TaxID=3037260 RepID=UPI0024185A72|nr:hypothetical protein [Jeotgalibacillus sp. ET6]MDG5473913.1 hypothetical protein [Jeotgalibacillus sp. ET6]